MSGEHELFAAAPPAVANAVSGEQWVAGMMLFEINLAAAEEDAGVLPAGTARAIAGAAARVRVSAESLRDESPGTPVIRLVELLAAEAGDAAGRWVHHGATSQDALDTALALVLRGAATALLDELVPSTQRLAELADEHRRTVMPGRTLLQQGSPTTFGVKCAHWLVALLDAIDDLVTVAGAVPVQLGGGVGTFAVLGDKGPEVAARLGRLLELPVPPVPWHSDRAPVARAGAALGLVAGVISKIARDLVLMAQTEVGEVSEGGEGGGMSSAMPHKRNPAQSIEAIAAARQAVPLAGALATSLDHELERAAGAWQAEAMTLCDLIVHVGRAAAALRRALTVLEIDAARMRRNLDARGTWAAEVAGALLAARVGRDIAHDAVRAASATPSLARALAADARVAAHLDALDGVFEDPLLAAGPVDELVGAALEYRSRGRFAP